MWWMWLLSGVTHFRCSTNCNGKWAFQLVRAHRVHCCEFMVFFSGESWNDYGRRNCYGGFYYADSREWCRFGMNGKWRGVWTVQLWTHSVVVNIILFRIDWTICIHNAIGIIKKTIWLLNNVKWICKHSSHINDLRTDMNHKRKTKARFILIDCVA